jgi:hypothetical protein
MKELENLKVEFDEVSPITENKCVLVEADPNTNEESRICIESGYTTRDSWKVTPEGEFNEVVAVYEENITALMRDTKFIDEETGHVWYLANMVTPGVMLYPTGDSPSRFEWEVAMVVQIFGEERKKYPIPGRPGEFYTKRVDIDNARRFKKNNFAGALDEFYKIVTEILNNTGQQ